MAIGADRTSKSLLKCLLLLHSSLISLPGQWDHRQSCKYTLGAISLLYLKIFQSHAITFLGVRLWHTLIWNMFYGVRFLYVWHFTHGQTWMKTLEQCQWHRSSAFIVDYEHISNFVLTVDSERANVYWDHIEKTNALECKIYVML